MSVCLCVYTVWLTKLARVKHNTRRSKRGHGVGLALPTNPGSLLIDKGTQRVFVQ
jgi:hypothetical protein